MLILQTNQRSLHWPEVLYVYQVPLYVFPMVFLQLHLLQYHKLNVSLHKLIKFHGIVCHLIKYLQQLRKKNSIT